MSKLAASLPFQNKAVVASVLILFLVGAPNLRSQDSYDIVILHGRVMDPDSGLDGVRNVGIRGSTIEAITAEMIRGKNTIDAKGLVVAPGFIDLHEHGQEPANYRCQAHDGVTTSLELEHGTDDVSRWYAERENKALINYGVSIGHIPVRMKVMKDPGKITPTGDAAYRQATPEELAQIEQLMETGLKQGALGVGMGINWSGPQI